MADRDHAAQLRRGVIELAALALLAREPLYGAAIVDALAAHPGLDSNAGTVYPLLTRLRSGGLVTTEWQESPVGPPRKVYSLTSTGRSHLAAMTATWRTLSESITDLLEDQ